jgi:hypothetical protein
MLREVFGYGYPDMARITGKTEVSLTSPGGQAADGGA